LHRLAQAQGLAEMQHGGAPVDDDVQEFAKAADQNPVFDEKQAPQARLLVRRPAPEDGDRDQIDVKIRICGGGRHQVLEIARRARHQARAEEARAAGQFKISSIGPRGADPQAPFRTRQA
jgi:hypothetical protein